jgi:hypothetical protein
VTLSGDSVIALQLGLSLLPCHPTYKEHQVQGPCALPPALLASGYCQELALASVKVCVCVCVC